jgi:succinate-acetate transporter protein
MADALIKMLAVIFVSVCAISLVARIGLPAAAGYLGLVIRCFLSVASPKMMPQTSSLRFELNSKRNCADA